MTSEMIGQACKALGDPTRLHIVEFLSCCLRTVEVDETGGVIGPTAGEICCHITGAEKISSTVSHHLHELEIAGLVTLEKRGKRTVCSLRPEGLLSLADALYSLAKGENNGCC